MKNKIYIVTVLICLSFLCGCCRVTSHEDKLSGTKTTRMIDNLITLKVAIRSFKFVKNTNLNVEVEEFGEYTILEHTPFLYINADLVQIKSEPKSSPDNYIVLTRGASATHNLSSLRIYTDNSRPIDIKLTRYDEVAGKTTKYKIQHPANYAAYLTDEQCNIISKARHIDLLFLITDKEKFLREIESNKILPRMIYSNEYLLGTLDENRLNKFTYVLSLS